MSDLMMAILDMQSRASDLRSKLGLAERTIGTRLIKRKGDDGIDILYGRVCRACGKRADMAHKIEHDEGCPFFIPCVSRAGHLWQLVGDRERDEIAGTGGWDLYYLCSHQECSEAMFLRYDEREAFEARVTLTDPLPSYRERHPERFAKE